MGFRDPRAGTSQSYDANGNLTSVTGPAPRTVTWWSHNKPRRMTRNADNYSEYWYGPGGDRGVFKQESRIAGALSTVIYGSALYERRTQGATVEHTHYIQANGITVATVRRYGTSTANTTRYLHRDHLGSVVLITNEAGNVTETLAYDAWGKRRPPSTWITHGAGTFLHAQWLRRGFTADEHIDHVGLIHMGGRVYDPEIGRFLSPDPFVQYPGSAQGMNRYAYVGNNPLSATDPSGYFIQRLFRTALIVGAAYFTGAGATLLWGKAAGAAIGGAVGGYLSSGNLQGALFGMVGGMFAHGIGEVFQSPGFGDLSKLTGKSVAHGVSQGLLARAGGGRFGDGALGGFFGSLTGPVAGKVQGGVGQTLAAATLGGTAAAIGGGKFANGALSAAFVDMFNRQAHAGNRLPEFRGDEVVIDASMASSNFEFFGFDGLVMADMTTTDLAFAQSLLIESLEATYKMNILRATALRGTRVPLPAEIRRAVRLISNSYRGHRLLEATRGRGNLDNPFVNRRVQITLTRNFRNEFLTRMNTGTYPSYSLSPE